MKKLFSITVLFILIITTGNGQITAYQPGEKVNYIIHYGLVTGGVASLEMNRDTCQGNNVWHSKMIARTTGMADAIFKVKDIFECYLDSATELPIKSIRNVSEGR